MKYVPKLVDWKEMKWEEVSKIYDENREQLEECDKKARDANRMVGRYIQHQFADGYAVYQIIKSYKDTVRIRVCTGLGDDWVLPAWGRECTIDMDTALRFLGWRDSMLELFGGEK
jgi:hypothetical protein